MTTVVPHSSGTFVSGNNNLSLKWRRRTIKCIYNVTISPANLYFFLSQMSWMNVEPQLSWRVYSVKRLSITEMSIQLKNLYITSSLDLLQDPFLLITPLYELLLWKLKYLNCRGGSRGCAPHPPPLNWKKYDFSHEIPQIFSCLIQELKKIWFFGVKSWFFTRNTPKMFTPPSARGYFFKCAPPPNLKSWISP